MKQISNYNELISILNDTDGKVFLKISTETCGPCRAMAPTIAELEKAHQDVAFIECNAEECDEDILAKFNVRNVPVIIVLNDGKVQDQTVGLQTKDALEERLSK